MTEQPSIEVVSTEEILGLRMAVLRDGTPSQDPRYPEDDLAHSEHLAVRFNDAIVGTSTWLTRPWPHDPTSLATQLRGMAIAPDVQRHGFGALLLGAGIDRSRGRGHRFVWARARDTAIGFYERNGFTVVGDAFIDDATGMSHHLVVNEITPKR
jgi:GNAT superfamily N-acetyltransferase